MEGGGDGSAFFFFTLSTFLKFIYGYNTYLFIFGTILYHQLGSNFTKNLSGVHQIPVKNNLGVPFITVFTDFKF